MAVLRVKLWYRWESRWDWTRSNVEVCVLCARQSTGTLCPRCSVYTHHECMREGACAVCADEVIDGP